MDTFRFSAKYSDGSTLPLVTAPVLDGFDILDGERFVGRVRPLLPGQRETVFRNVHGQYFTDRWTGKRRYQKPLVYNFTPSYGPWAGQKCRRGQRVYLDDVLCYIYDAWADASVPAQSTLVLYCGPGALIDNVQWEDVQWK
jgi:hypothetical protein